MMDESRKLKALKMASHTAVEKGLTTVHALEDGDLAPGDAPFLMKHRKDIDVRIVIYPQIMDVEAVEKLGLPRIGGCILADGALENRTAALFEAYSDSPGNYGTLYYPASVIEAFVMEAHEKGFQIALHAIGERAIDQVLTAYEKALAKIPRKDHRHRLEHFEFPTWYQIERATRSHIVLTLNPGLIHYAYGPDLQMMYERLTPTRMKRFHPYKQICEAGILASGGSDAPCSPLDPLTGICYLVIHPVKENGCSVREAVKMFTIDAAACAFEEQDKGSLEPGKLADMVILNADPFAIPSKEIKDIGVLKTIIGGKTVYSRDQ
jgi:predicted amidohydrolase YtcJ